MLRKRLVYLILAIVTGLSLPPGQQLTAATPTVASIHSHTEHSRPIGGAAHHGHLPAAINPTHHLPIPLLPAVEAETEQEQEVAAGKEFKQVKRLAFFSNGLCSSSPWSLRPELLRIVVDAASPGISRTILYQVFRL